MAMVAFLPSSVAAAHLPISLPALKLSVAKVMSTVSAGSGGVSRAMTYRPASRAFLMAALTPVVVGVIRMPLSPRATAVLDRRDLALASSPSCLPGGDRERRRCSSSPASRRPSAWRRRTGWCWSLVISVTAICRHRRRRSLNLRPQRCRCRHRRHKRRT